MTLNNFIRPKSVAIIGASANQAKLGYQILANLKNGGYGGAIYPVNLKEKKILGLAAYPSIKAIKKKIDLALIVIPSEFILAELENCAQAGVKNIIIVSAGFAETDEAGKKRERDLQVLAKQHGLNILGPNCLGYINAKEKLNLTFARTPVLPGNVAMLSQSGALGSAALDWASGQPFGFSQFISLGNKAVLSENDFIEALINDKQTKLVVAYLEEIEDGGRFMAAVSRLAKAKPVAVLKAGRTKTGAKAALSHTGSLAGSFEATVAGLKRAGAIVLDEPEEMFDLIRLAERDVELKDFKLYIISNAGGPLVLAADEAERTGLVLGELSKQTKQDLKPVLPAAAHLDNPLDLIGDADAQRYQAAIETILGNERHAGLLILLTPQTATEIDRTAEVVAAAAAKHPKKLIATSFLGGKSLIRAKEILAAGKVPDFAFPEQAIRVIAKLARNRLEAEELKPYDGASVATEEAKRTGEPFGSAQGEQMDYLAALALIDQFKIATVKTTKIASANDLEGLTYPVAMKVVGRKVLHKTDRQAVVLNLKNLAQARVAYNRFAPLLKDNANYCIAQPMVEGGLELILGFKRDQAFGPLIMAGLGGIYAEVFKDVAVAVGDLDEKRARAILESLKCYPILAGARGQSFDQEAVTRAIVALAKLANKHPEISELDINPLFVTRLGILAADVRIII